MDSGLQNLGDMAITQANAARANSKIAPTANVDKASQDFAGMFMTQMLQPMFEGIEVDETFGGGHGEQIMRSFMVQEYGKVLATSSGFGLSAAVKAEMIKMQQTAK